MLRFSFYLLLSAFVAGVVTVGAVLWYVLPDLPSADTLREVHLQTPLRVFTADGRLIAEFGEKRRLPVAIDDVPDLVKLAFIASEDDRFYEHPGVDWIAITRAAIELVQTREKKQGGSTITMQLARNFFLTPEKTYERKVKEIVLAIKIEQELTKDEILELYLNKIFLGHRAYGIGAAAQVYYGATLDELNVAQIAMIAGLPKAPSITNPVTNPKAAEGRREYVLSRMLKLGFIDQQAYDEALREPVATVVHGLRAEVEAPYLAEMVRSYLRENYESDAYTAGYRVYTTVTSRLQMAANAALTAALLDYDRRHGYRGPEHHIDISQMETPDFAGLLNAYIELGALHPALVVAVNERDIEVARADGAAHTVPWEGMKWARKFLSHNSLGASPKTAGEILKVGDVVRIEWIKADPASAKKTVPADGAPQDAGYWRLAQIPEVEGALVSIKADDGAIQALVGGFDFRKSKFNRVNQAMRQPGSNFKPFIYSAALEQGYTAATFVNDAPIVFDAPGLESAWRPENYSGRYYGPTPLRQALAHSRNLVSIRLLRAMGVKTVVEHIGKFGFDTNRLPKNLSMSLGSGELTPLELVSGYAVLANGGYRIEPYFIERIENENGDVIMRSEPPRVCRSCETETFDDDGEPMDIAALIESTQNEKRRAERVLDPNNAWIMNSMMRDVIKIGTGRRALSLNRNDLAGKTGTTNDQKDAWFSGFNGDIVTTVWVGFDDSKPLGKRETGSSAALPMWIDYMGVALDGTPESTMERPAGLVTVKIDPSTGLLAGADDPNAIFESFRADNVPKPGKQFDSPLSSQRRQPEPEHLF